MGNGEWGIAFNVKLSLRGGAGKRLSYSLFINAPRGNLFLEGKRQKARVKRRRRRRSNWFFLQPRNDNREPGKGKAFGH
jgi:hypothetical protein